MKTKTINTCGHPQRRHDGHGRCGACALRYKLSNLSEEQLLSYKEDKRIYSRIRAKTRQGKASVRNHKLKTCYGITVEDYDNYLESQNGLCAICLKPETAKRRDSDNAARRLSVDHCHSDGKFRGLLCSSCNAMLGNAKDNVETLRSAITYLESSYINAGL